MAYDKSRMNIMVMTIKYQVLPTKEKLIEQPNQSLLHVQVLYSLHIRMHYSY